jgi:hypothetical protein
MPNCVLVLDLVTISDNDERGYHDCGEPCADILNHLAFGGNR